MKKNPALFLFVILLGCSSVFSQEALEANLNNHSVLKSKWQPTQNWLHAFRTVFGKDATTNWMSELALNGNFYLNKRDGGFIIVLPDYIQNKAVLQSKIRYGIFENKNTRLLPLRDEAIQSYNLNMARFMGFLGNVPATLEMVVVKENGKYLTIMGFYPSHELASDFSKNFEKLIERIYPSPVYAYN